MAGSPLCTRRWGHAPSPADPPTMEAGYACQHAHAVPQHEGALLRTLEGVALESRGKPINASACLTPDNLVDAAADQPEYRQPDADRILSRDEIVQADDIRKLQRVIPGKIFRLSCYQGAEPGREPETCSRQPAPHDAIRLFHGRRRTLLRRASRFMDVG